MATSGYISVDASAAQAKKNAGYFKKLLQGMQTQMQMGSSGMGSVREADHHGHHITIKTTYQITIDGKPFKGMLGVTNAGTVHYHGMPSAGFASALELIKSVIDVFPEEFPAGSGGETDMPGMDMTGMSGMSGMAMKGMRGGRKKSSARRKPARRQ